jgi:hypothetical protein
MMPRNVSDAKRADETVTVRVPTGTAAKVRAATGQHFSTVVRWMVMQLLENYAKQIEGNVKEHTREDVQRTVQEALKRGD